MKNRFCCMVFVVFFCVCFLPFSDASGNTQPKEPAGFSASENEELDDDLMADFEDDIPDSEAIADPLYYFNYAMYGVNDFLYFGIMKPIATGYKTVTPTPVRKGVSNFFHNLLFPVRFVNNLLQGKFHSAGTEVGIFLMNSTGGVLGFGQVAQNRFDMHTSQEDLGQTFGSYSIGNGCYLVLPFFGPSTLRDTVGLVGDSFMNPIRYLDPAELSVGVSFYRAINETTFRIGDYEALKEAALDPYVALRNAYIQNRKMKVAE